MHVCIYHINSWNYNGCKYSYSICISLQSIWLSDSGSCCSYKLGEHTHLKTHLRAHINFLQFKKVMKVNIVTMYSLPPFIQSIWSCVYVGHAVPIIGIGRTCMFEYILKAPYHHVCTFCYNACSPPSM